MVKSTELISRSGASALTAGLAAAFLAVFMVPVHPTQAAPGEADKGPQLLMGGDDDRQDNPAVQAGAGVNQSLGRTDVLTGGSANDVIFGLNGNDVIDGGP